jgi:aminobenzoyl-glutamate utilization protein A
VARILATIRSRLPAGTVRLIFQPGEEGARGAVAMLRKQVVDDADFFLAAHIGGRDLPVGELVAAATTFHASTKLDAHFVGRPAHAGANPEEGRNALLAASTAVLGLHAIPHHGGGLTFVNVGTLRAGGSRNVVPARAYLQLETRGEGNDLNAFMEAAARRALGAAAVMHGVDVTVHECGRTLSARADADLAALVAQVASSLPDVTRVHDRQPLEGGEDATFFMRRVQERGGRAGYMILGASQPMGHHSDQFDFDEEVLRCGVRVFCAVTIRLLAGSLGTRRPGQ